MALSTTESEYMAISEASKEGQWLIRLINSVGIEQSSILLHSDSQSALQLVNNPVFHSRTKHIDI